MNAVDITALWVTVQYTAVNMEELDPVTYYMLLLPTTLPVILFFLILAWIGRKFFTNN